MAQAAESECGTEAGKTEMNIKEILERKKKWRSSRQRIRELPKAYQIVYRESESYLMKVFCVEGIRNSDILAGLLLFFEECAASGKDVLEVTGPDVAAFCDGLLE